MEIIDFYYSIGSRYSYLAFTQLEKLEKEAKCRIQLNPVNSLTILSKREDNPFDVSTSSGQYDWGYRELDAKRWADFYDVSFIVPRGRVKFDSELIALAAVAAKRLGVVREYSNELYKAMFADAKVTIIDKSECIRRALNCSISEADFVHALESVETVKELSRTLEKCSSINIFGVPTYVVGDQQFWGNDRIALVRHHIKHNEIGKKL
jgi:2-hydroxychromene-2-carboxylate isomerase